MGYTTDFEGQFKLNKPLTAAHKAYLVQFSETRRMERNAKKVAKLPDPIREAAGLPVGEEGEFFVGGAGFCGQDQDESIEDYNRSPSTQPGLWCQWVPTEDGQGIEWNQAEKFYEYVAWLQYIISKFLIPWDYTVNGSVKWFGEDRTDFGVIMVHSNIITAKAGKMVY